MLKHCSSIRPLRRIENLSPQHRAIIVDFVTQRCGASLNSGVFDNWITSANRLRILAGKKFQEISAKALRAKIGIPSRSRVTQMYKGPKDLTIVTELLAKLERDHPRIGVALGLCMFFGLRIQEALCIDLRLGLTQALDSRKITITRGAKNNRARTIPLSRNERLYAEQIGILEDAQALASERFGSLIPSDSSLVFYMRFYFRVAARYGLTKKALGFTAHSLRHAAANQHGFERDAVPSEVLVPGQWISSRDPVQLARRQQVTEFLGHADPTKTSSYFGPPSSFARAARQSNQHARNSSDTG